MTAKQLFSKTMPFVWTKLLLGGATVLVCVILLAIFMGLGWLFGDTAIVIMFILWLGSIGAVRYFIMRAMGYLVKADILQLSQKPALPDRFLLIK